MNQEQVGVNIGGRGGGGGGSEGGKSSSRHGQDQQQAGGGGGSPQQGLTSSSSNNEYGHYAVTAHRAGSVLLTQRCSFLSPDSIDVVVAKACRLEVRQFHPSTLFPTSTSFSRVGQVEEGNNKNNSDDMMMTMDNGEEEEEEEEEEKEGIEGEEEEEEGSGIVGGGGSGPGSSFPIVLDLPIRGRVCTLLSFRPPNAKTDFLFFSTERHRYGVLSYNFKTQSVITHDYGSLHDLSTTCVTMGKESECGPIATVDPSNRCIAIHIYDGYIKILPIVPYKVTSAAGSGGGGGGLKGFGGVLGAGGRKKDKNVSSGLVGDNSNINNKGKKVLGDAFNVRLDYELTLLSYTFLYDDDIVLGGIIGGGGGGGGESSTKSSALTQNIRPCSLCILHQDSRGTQHVVTYGIDFVNRDLIKPSSTSTTATKSPSMPGGGGGGVGSTSSGALGGVGGSGGGKAGTTMIGPKKSRVDAGSGMIIPVPPAPSPVAVGAGAAAAAAGKKKSNSGSICGGGGGGILIVGRDQITYLNRVGGGMKILPMEHCVMLAYGNLTKPLALSSSSSSLKVDASGDSNKWSSFDDTDDCRFLLGDDRGYLYVLALTRAASSSSSSVIVTGLYMERIGTTCLSSNIEYLGYGITFVGSQFGDSQLIQIMNERNSETLSYVELVDEYTNLGPIVDFDLVDLDRKGQCQIVTCSGVAGDGSIRVIRNGIGIHEQADVEIPGIKGMWNLRSSFSDIYDKYLVQSFINETRILEITDDEMEETYIPGFIHSGSSTLFACNVRQNLLVQVTQEEVILVDCLTLEAIDRWIPQVSGMMMNRGERITVASGNEYGQIVVALRGGVIVSLDIVDVVEELEENNEEEDEEEDGIDIDMSGSGRRKCCINCVGMTELDHEVSCVNLNPFEALCSSHPTSILRSKNKKDGGDIDVGHGGDPSMMDIDDVEQEDGKRENKVGGGGGGGGRVMMATRSDYVAVGLWNDFTVRILHLGSSSSSTSNSTTKENFFGSSDNNVDTMMNNDNDEEEGDGEGEGRKSDLLLKEALRIDLGGDTQARSLLMTIMEGTQRMLLVGLGDGQLISYFLQLTTTATTTNDAATATTTVKASSESQEKQEEQEEMGGTSSGGGSGGKCLIATSRKKVSLGTQSVSLSTFRNASNGNTCVFASGDRPTVVYMNKGKISYSNINLSTSSGGGSGVAGGENTTSGAMANTLAAAGAATGGGGGGGGAAVSDEIVNWVCPFHCELFPDCLCLASEEMLRIGTIDDIQKLHVQTWRLGESPRRICHFRHGRLFAVGCISGGSSGGGGDTAAAATGGGNENDRVGGDANMGNSIRFLDDCTFEEIHRIDLDPFEMILSLMSCNLVNSAPTTTNSSSSTTAAAGSSSGGGDAATGGTGGTNSTTAAAGDNSGMDTSTSSSAGGGGGKFGGVMSKPYILAGTAYAYPDEDEPTRGRILVFETSAGGSSTDATTAAASSSAAAASASASAVGVGTHASSGVAVGAGGGGGGGGGGSGGGLSRTVRQVTELHARGGVYSMCPFENGSILATVNSKTVLCRLHDYHDGIVELRDDSTAVHHGHIISLFVKSAYGRPGAAGGAASSAGTAMMDLSDAGMGMHLEDAAASNNNNNNNQVGGSIGDDIDNLALVGDMMRSISVLQYHHPQTGSGAGVGAGGAGALIEIARDYNANWTTAIEMLTSTTYLGAENWNNLFTLRRNVNSPLEEIRCRLDCQGEYHLGEMVNKFARGSLVMPSSSSTSSSSSSSSSSSPPSNPASSSSSGKNGADGDGGGSGGGGGRGGESRRGIAGGAAAIIPTISRISIGSQTLYGTVDGSIGVIMGLDKLTFTFLKNLERCMSNELLGSSIGGLRHDEFRAFVSERRVHPCRGFIDGDLIESFMDLSRVEMERIVHRMNAEAGVLVSGSSSSSSTSSSWSKDGRRRQGGGVHDEEGGKTEEEKQQGGRGGSGAKGTATTAAAPMHHVSENKIPCALTVEDVLNRVEEMSRLH